ncbi:hypothetical protein [Moraxella sp. ZY200743]|uniref:hypothetical protein n=1 Tax=Moraxella sp. ZY200743 TaxID=2911970 RepID=UPI003D7DDE46
MTHDELVKQYFMNPNVVDAVAEAKVSDAILYYKMITDEKYVPKTLEEAKQHPLWVDGHINGIHSGYKILLTAVIFSYIFCLFKGTYINLDLFENLIWATIHHLVPFLVALFAVKKPASPVTSPTAIFILGILGWILTQFISDTLQVTKNAPEVYLPLIIYILISLPLTLSYFTNKTAYRLKYLNSYKITQEML